MSSNYKEIIEFTNRVGAPKRQRGHKITDDLVVSYPTPYRVEERYRIWSIESGRPVINLDFTTSQEAERFARYLDSVYHEFWFLLSEYPKMSIPQVCMWTVPNGIRIWLTIDMLQNRKDVRLTPQTETDTITLDDIKRAYQTTKDKVADYMKFPQKG